MPRPCPRRSSDGRRGSQLSDLREDALLAGGADLAGLLPAVGEEEVYAEESEQGGSAKRRRVVSGASGGTAFGGRPACHIACTLVSCRTA